MEWKNEYIILRAIITVISYYYRQCWRKTKSKQNKHKHIVVYLRIISYKKKASYRPMIRSYTNWKRTYTIAHATDIFIHTKYMLWLCIHINNRMSKNDLSYSHCHGWFCDKFFSLWCVFYYVARYFAVYFPFIFRFLHASDFLLILLKYYMLYA